MTTEDDARGHGMDVDEAESSSDSHMTPEPEYTVRKRVAPARNRSPSLPAKTQTRRRTKASSLSIETKADGVSMTRSASSTSLAIKKTLKSSNETADKRSRSVDTERNNLYVLAGPGRPARVQKPTAPPAPYVAPKLSSEMEERRQKLSELAAFNVKRLLGREHTLFDLLIAAEIQAPHLMRQPLLSTSTSQSQSQNSPQENWATLISATDQARIREHTPNSPVRNDLSGDTN
ncbi:hypothetical protein SmJEL517_g02818 [Synchytrium microbalum]|uniref:Uncharacterized protein n=1 Tax=Synchytrium microbalum TaxID=1806994 RepID=A0A507C4G7_9FUNG|nr:uncharacterized protein SmJEL517_g02818 [Synchytrium microbalum]TPX34562.1 hypothetical protein SmJEL517_g02818 [Synchytrium microbalum]